MDKRICPHEVEEIYQGEELYIGGCLYDDDEEALDLASMVIKAQITSRNGYRKSYTSEDGGITKEPDKGVFSLVVTKDITAKMRGEYFIAFSVEVEGKPLVSELYKAFEVKQSSISK